MTKITNNDEKYNAYKKRKILRILIIILCIATIALAILSLIFKFSCIYALVVFLIMTVLRSYRDKLDFNKKTKNKEGINVEKKK